MMRKQIYLSEEADKALKRLAVAKGRSESELIREAIDGYLSRHEQTQDPWDALVGLVPEGDHDESRRVDEVVYNLERKL